jgi:hypothetical protein
LGFSEATRIPSNRLAIRQSRSHNLINIPITKTTNAALDGSLPKFLLLNARSILNKKEELEVIISQCSPDVVMITETWLSDIVPDEVVNIPKFSLVRKDRPIGRGGGVQVYIRESITYKLRLDLSNDQYECVWIVLRPVWLPRSISRIAIACVYIPPSVNMETVNSFCDYFCYCYDKLKSESPCTAIIAAGDFNPDSNGLNIRTITRQCHIKQIVKTPTRGNAVLDLIITDIHKFYEDPEILPPLGTSDHKRIVWRPKNRNQLGNKKEKRTVTVRPLRDSSILQFEQFIREYNWSFVFNAAEVDDGVRLFLEATNNMFDTFFPCKSIKVYEDDKPYITGRIKEMMHNRDKAYQRGQAERFKYLRNKIVSEIRKEKNKFYDKRIKPICSHNPKQWWKQIKKVVGTKKDSVSIIDPETENPLSAKESAEFINTFFTDLTKNYPEVADEWLTITADETLPQISVTNLIKKLKGIDANKAHGPFDPCLKIIKLFAEYFAVPLVHIFNQSFQTMKFPEVWKISNFCAIPKTTPCNRVEELRPISLTSVLSKVQESYAVEWILEDVQEEISDSQFGGLRNPQLF